MANYNDPKNFVEQRAPEYIARVADWERFAKAYRGGRAYAQECIQPYAFEHKENLDARQARAVDWNYIGSLARQWASFFSRNLPTIEPEFPEVYAEDFDLQGNALTTYLRRIATATAVMGHVWGFVDVPRAPNGIRPANRAQQAALGMRPYFTLFAPWDVLNWGLDNRGKVTWCLIQQPLASSSASFDPAAPATPKLQKVEDRNFMFWNHEAWALMDKDGKVLATEIHGLGEVPIVPFRFTSDILGGFIGTGLYDSIEPLNRAINRLWSLLEDLLGAFYSQHVIEGEFSAPAVRGADGKLKEGKIATGKDVFLPVSKGSKIYTIGQDPSYADRILAAISTAITEIHRLANLKKGQAVDGGAGDASVSGRAKAFDFMDTNQALADHALHLADGLANVLRLFDLWEGRSVVYGVTFPQDFGVDNADTFIEAARALGTSGISRPPAFDAELLIACVKALFPNKPSGELAKLEKIIRDFQPTDEMAGFNPFNARAAMPMRPRVSEEGEANADAPA